MKETLFSTMAHQNIPPYLYVLADLQIPIPNTHHRLPLSWDHVIAIRKLKRFFGRGYREMQARGQQDVLDWYGMGMTTFLELDTTIQQGENILLEMDYKLTTGNLTS